ncbi:GumC family protein [Phormidium sp. CCY1219]|uniref:GumC family protein n=1 Tax=Phormidium sp. CCY1219 TaxID=2886104 RepID=UPI002D1EF1D8|nr:hypothetical protein [Phormidium sp. CCY1219]MEB3830747.1 hypothetical protein [Phormidium sp. CCY1219]
MTDFTATLKNYNSSAGSRKSSKRWPIYFGLGLVTNALVWGAAIAYLTLKAPSYATEWAITMPGVSSMTKVDVPGIGGSSSQTDSPYKSESHDPRENYKFIADSEAVIAAAAQDVNIPVKKFGEPRIEVVGNTTLMIFGIKGETAQLAQEKAIALHQAFQERLDELRTQEMAAQDQTLQKLLSRSQKNLQKAQQRLSEYKATASISSVQQVQDLSVNVENLRRQKAELQAQQQQTNARLNQLSRDLELTAQEANEAFVLQADPMFQDYLTKYKQASAELVSLNSIYKAQHPQMLAKQKEIDDARTALMRRSEAVLGRPVNPREWETQINEGSSSTSAGMRQNLMQQLIAVQAENEGLVAKNRELDQQIVRLEGRLKKLSVQESTLENLKRDVQIAEAVFSSTLTQLDMSKSKVFSVYPQIQMIRPPKVPKEPSSPKTLYAILGAGMATVFLSTGCIALWLRDRHMQKAKQRKRSEPHNPLIVADSHTQNPSHISSR